MHVVNETASMETHFKRTVHLRLNLVTKINHAYLFKENSPATGYACSAGKTVSKTILLPFPGVVPFQGNASPSQKYFIL